MNVVHIALCKPYVLCPRSHSLNLDASHLITCCDCNLLWHSKSHLVPHLPINLWASYHCEVLHLKGYVSMSLYKLWMSVVTREMQEITCFFILFPFLSLYPFLSSSLLFSFSFPNPGRLEICVWSNILIHTALPDTLCRAYTCSLIRWVNPM